MRIFRKVLFIVIAVLAVIFAVSNRALVTLNLWPLPFETTLPLYMIVLGAAGVGLLIGAAISWFSKERMWLRARGAERKAEGLQRVVEREREAARPPQRTALAPAARAARIDDE